MPITVNCRPEKMIIDNIVIPILNKNKENTTKFYTKFLQLDQGVKIFFWISYEK